MINHCWQRKCCRKLNCPMSPSATLKRTPSVTTPEACRPSDLTEVLRRSLSTSVYVVILLEIPSPALGVVKGHTIRWWKERRSKCQCIKKWCHVGGKPFASFESSLYIESGKQFLSMSQRRKVRRTRDDMASDDLRTDS